jgi:hypothetical protein
MGGRAAVSRAAAALKQVFQTVDISYFMHAAEKLKKNKQPVTANWRILC